VAPSANIPESLAEFTHPIDDLHPFHKNPRTGNVSVIAESLRTNGQYKPIVVNRGTHTGRPNEILAGNHTWQAARQLGWEQIAVTWVDKDDDDCNRIVVVDNRSSDLAGYDSDLLADLLSEMPELDGTGFDQEQVDELLDSIHVPALLRTETIGDQHEAPKGAYISWGNMKAGGGRIRLQLSDDEITLLNALHDYYYNDRGTDAGFGFFLVDPHHAHLPDRDSDSDDAQDGEPAGA
jgi:hypothetical protein